MNCEKCGFELAGNAIICPACKHNNARRAVSQWRARKTAELQESPYGSSAPPPKSNNEEPDEKLISFPASSRTSSYLSQPQDLVAAAALAGAAVETAGLPAWREQVRQKVRMVREKRQQEILGSPLSSEEAKQDINQNPIVESALKRIRRPEQAVPAILVRPARNSAQPVLWREDEEETEEIVEPGPKTQPRPIAPRVEERFKSPPLPPKNTQSLPKRTTKPITEQPTKPATRTLAARINPFAPVAKSESKDRISNDSVILTPRTRSTPAPERKEPEKKSAPRENPQSVATEIIEVTHRVNQTPRRVAAKPATLWLRTLAGACDFEIIATAYLPLFGAFATLNTSYGSESLLVMAVLLSTCVFAYQVVMLQVAGRTFGMALLNLNLVNTDDDQMPVTRRQKMLRAWAATIAFLILPLNYFLGKLNRSNRTLPDFFSGTTIVGR